MRTSSSSSSSLVEGGGPQFARLESPEGEAQIPNSAEPQAEPGTGPGPLVAPAAALCDGGAQEHPTSSSREMPSATSGLPSSSLEARLSRLEAVQETLLDCAGAAQRAPTAEDDTQSLEARLRRLETVQGRLLEKLQPLEQMAFEVAEISHLLRRLKRKKVATKKAQALALPAPQHGGSGSGTEDGNELS